MYVYDRNILSRSPNLHTLLAAQVDAGFLEGIVRGYKAGLLTQNQYNNLTQCETIEGI
jgi:hypothetical protein